MKKNKRFLFLISLTYWCIYELQTPIQGALNMQLNNNGWGLDTNLDRVIHCQEHVWWLQISVNHPLKCGVRVMRTCQVQGRKLYVLKYRWDFTCNKNKTVQTHHKILPGKIVFHYTTLHYLLIYRIDYTTFVHRKQTPRSQLLTIALSFVFFFLIQAVHDFKGRQNMVQRAWELPPETLSVPKNFPREDWRRVRCELQRPGVVWTISEILENIEILALLQGGTIINCFYSDSGPLFRKSEQF